jgi:Leucine-rich repeat (LRR) protein
MMLQIGHLKELVHLRSLPKLIILDLSGNPMCREEDYRPYVMYHLRKLNVLDGTPFDAAEQAAARDKYDGRITYEFLIDRMGQPPKPFEQLVELDLSNSRLRSAEGLDGQRLTALRELNLEGNLLTHCRGLGSLKALQVLRLSNNRIVSTEMQSVSSQADGLSALGSTLQVLQMANNRITSIAGLHLGRMNELRVLYLQGNEITNIDGLDGCPMLRELVLDRNKIKKLDPRGFYGLQNLRELRLEENGLRTCAGMPQLPRLQLLYLSSNRLADLSEINYIAQQPVLLELILAGNPLSRKPMYRPSTVRRMMQLRFLDGKEVFDDERERAELLFANDGSSQPAGQYEFRTVTEQHEPHQPSPSVMQQHSMQQQQRGSFNGISAPTRDNRDTRDTRDSRINATSSASGMSITGSSPSPNLSSVAEPLQAGSFRPIALPAASATASYSTTSMVQSSSGRSRSMMQPQPPQHQFADESAHRGPSPHNQLHSLSSQAVTFDGGAGLGITGSGNSFGLDKRKPAPVTMASNLPPARGKVEAGTIGAGALASIAISGYGSNMGPSMASGLGSTVSSGRRATLPTNTMRPVSGQPPPLYNAISASQLLQVLGNNNNNSHTAAGSGRAAVAAVAAANAPRPPPMPPGAAARGGRRPAGINMFQA